MNSELLQQQQAGRGGISRVCLCLAAPEWTVGQELVTCDECELCAGAPLALLYVARTSSLRWAATAAIISASTLNPLPHPHPYPYPYPLWVPRDFHPECCGLTLQSAQGLARFTCEDHDPLVAQRRKDLAGIILPADNANVSRTSQSLFAQSIINRHRLMIQWMNWTNSHADGKHGRRRPLF